MVNVARVNAQQARRFLTALWVIWFRHCCGRRSREGCQPVVCNRSLFVWLSSAKRSQFVHLFRGVLGDRADLAHQKVETRFQVTEFEKAFKPVNADQSRVATDSLVDATYRVVERESKPGKTRPPAFLYYFDAATSSQPTVLA